MKIDIFAHVLPKQFFERLRQKSKVDFSKIPSHGNPALSQIDIRLRAMDRYPDVLQVLTLVTPPLETLVTPGDAVELAKICNDEMAELVVKYPDKFIAGVACLPLSDIDASLKEADRAITQLHLRGVQIFTNINGEPLDAAKFRPLYEKMAHYDLPLWIHPWGEPMTAAKVPSAYHWQFETSSAMARLADSWVFEDYPNIKFITHHCGGGLVPFYGHRVRIANLHKFYNDTAVYGSTDALMCGYAYFGADHILFGTDAPLGRTRQAVYGGFTWDTIRSIERMGIPDIDKDKIFIDNARQLIKLEAL